MDDFIYGARNEGKGGKSSLHLSREAEARGTTRFGEIRRDSISDVINADGVVEMKSGNGGVGAVRVLASGGRNRARDLRGGESDAVIASPWNYHPLGSAAP